MSSEENKINTFLTEKNTVDLLLFCRENKFFSLEYLLKLEKPEMKTTKILKAKPTILVKLLCNWCSSHALMQTWNKMSKDNNYTWNNIQLTTDDKPDYFVVINCTKEPHDKKKTFLFRMEPFMHKNPGVWGEEWACPKEENFLKVFPHEKEYNNIEWHISKTYRELSENSPVKTEILSTVLSEKYKDPGQIGRIDFVKFLEKKNLKIDVYGNNKWHYKNFKGDLPYHKKDDALFPYKYTFNAENNNIPNYFTEKLIDGILAECLVFYSGPDNISSYIDPRAFVRVTLSNFERDYEIVKQSIENNLYEERLPYIREAKRKILNELQFFPRLEREITQITELKKKDMKENTP